MTRDTIAPPGAGERAEKQRRKRVQRAFNASIAISLPIGFVVAQSSAERYGFLRDISSSGAAILIAVLAVSFIVAFVVYKRAVDELEWEANRAAAMGGVVALMLGYPVWFVAWRGGLVGEPSTYGLYIGTMIAAIATYAWKRFRP